MMDPKSIRPGALIELRDEETESWLQLTIVSVSESSGNVQCQMLTGEPIFATMSSLITGARLRPRDGSCRDCGDEAHDGPCIERVCSECGSPVASRCSQHPTQPVHVYRRLRYLADIVEERPYPTRETGEALRRDLWEQIRTLRDAEVPRQGRVMIKATERSEIISALENAMALIDSLPGKKRRSS